MSDPSRARSMMHVGTAALCVALSFGCATKRPTSAAVPAAQSVVSPSTDLADVPRILSGLDQRRTLLVLDIDDTLLTSAEFFGSDAWYEWQKSLSADSPGYVPCRFDVMAMNFESGTQRPTQENGPALINSIRMDKIILTARSDQYRGATIRELKAAGYELPRSLQPAAAGLQYRWQRNGATPPVAVSYRDGVFMVSGQDKGVLLLDLLRRLELAYQRVVLVDDGEKNIAAMRNALAAAGIDYHGVHYTRIDKSVDSQDLQAGIAGWEAWKQLLSSAYPQRLRRLQENLCGY